MTFDEIKQYKLETEIERLRAEIEQYQAGVRLLNNEIEYLRHQSPDSFVEAAEEIERMRAENAETHRKLDAIAKHPDTPMLIKQYASGALDGRALEPKP